MGLTERLALMRQNNNLEDKITQRRDGFLLRRRGVCVESEHEYVKDGNERNVFAFHTHCGTLSAVSSFTLVCPTLSYSHTQTHTLFLVKKQKNKTKKIFNIRLKCVCSRSLLFHDKSVHSS